MSSNVRQSLHSALLAISLLSAPLFAQTLGTVTGEVKDSSGAVVAGAAITVRNTATNGVRNATQTRMAFTPSPLSCPACTK